MSLSARPEGAWVIGNKVVRSIASGGHDAGHPFDIPGMQPTIADRRRLLAAIRDKQPAHVLAVTSLCDCSFESPFLAARPLQDFGLGPDGNRLVHPSQRRIVWPAGVLESLLSQLARGLITLHEIGVVHGDPAMLNALVADAESHPSALWVDLNSVMPVTTETLSVDVAAFELTCMWPALIDANQYSPSLFADLTTAALAAQPLSAYAEAFETDRDDHRVGGNRAGFGAALFAADVVAGDGPLGRARRRIAAAMAPSYFLDQTRSDQNARFFRTTLEAERTRHALIEEERTRLHYHRFQGEIDELRAWSQELQQGVEYHQGVADAERRRAGEQAESSRAALHNAEARAAVFRHEADAVRADLNDIYTSRAWRLVTRLRRAKSALVALLASPVRLVRRRAVEHLEQSVAAAGPEFARSLGALATRYPVVVSTIMPVFNKGVATVAAVDCVLNQTLCGVEVIIWDDGSTDPETLRVLDELEGRKDVTVFRASNRGVISARNSAMAYARGEFLACLDPDDSIAPTYYEKAVSLLRTQPDIAIAYPWQRTSGDKQEIWLTQDLNPSLIANVNHVPVCAVFRREVYVESGGFSPDMAAGYEDWEMWAHAAELGFKGRVIPEPLFEYHFSSSADESRDASAREQHLELATRIGTLHPLLEGDASAVAVRHAQPGWVGALPEMHLPRGEGRPIVLTIPWFTVGGADRVVEALVRHWIKQGRTVDAVTTVPLGEGMTNRVDALLELTPFVYQLDTLLPIQHWEDFLIRTLAAVPPATIVNIGSAWFLERAAEVRAMMQGTRIIDVQFNDIGHLDGNRKAAEAIDLTVAAYQALADVLRADGRPDDHVATVYVGIDEPVAASPSEVDTFRSEHGIEAEDRVVAYVGRLSEEKRPDWLTALADYIDAKMLIVGDGPLAGLAAELDRSKDVVWVRHLPDIAVALAVADVLVLPSRTEGIPLIAMEALATGTPVVATAVGGLPEFEGTPGLTLVDPEDFDVFVAAVVETLDRVAQDVVLPDGLTTDAMMASWDELVDP